ncbi:energy-coupling factor transporter transmembrane protein EcfT [bacterium BMS3Abin05]|nr:energy-coupling factor transporter transmembrane protein EcfT [bacterium BMS3Abin05]GBE26766.1 energy-coupling factor transporter transmembrane protein EcfT [bacterium BMS3Bbin03]HDL78506.1 energy-coupling factor transporter transmembrane protein EcfT [Bacteroidota bacterium]HDZ12103.1 energy-coupling factor transporter transmembrane protein EcfT [Bacteroidota bacterium]
MSPLKDITLGQFYPGDSVLHRLDPRTKLISLLVIMTAMVATNRFWAYGFFSIFLILVIYFSRVPVSLVGKNLRPFLWLFLLTFLLNIGYGPGKALFQIPVVHWTVTDTGVTRGIIYTARIILLILFAGVFTLVTVPIDITDGLSRLFSPLKKLGFPVAEFAMMTTIAIRFIPLLLDEADRIRKAQLARGAQIEGNLIRRIKGIIPVILPLFLSAFRKADDLALAMEARCYRIGETRTSFKRLRLTTTDYGVLLGTIVLSIGCVLV